MKFLQNIKLVKRMISLFFLSLIGSNLGNAQIKKISLQEAITLGIENSKSLKLSKSRAEIFQIKVDQAKNLLIPSISLNSQYTRLSDNVTPFTVALAPGVVKALNPQILNQYTNRASIQYPIFAGFRLQSSLDNVKLLEKASKLDVEQNSLEIKNLIITSYYNLVKGFQSKKILEGNLKQTNARINDIKNFKKAGIAIENDVLKADLLKNNLETSLLEVETNIQNLNYTIDLFLGLPTETIIEPTDDSPKGIYLDQTLESVVQLGLTQRKELQSAEIRKQAVFTTIKSSKANFYPVISLFGNYYFNNPNQRVFPNEDKFKYTADAGLLLTWNLSTLYTNQAIVNEANANYLQQQITIDVTKDNIKSEIYSNYNNWKLSKSKLALYEKAQFQAIENQRIFKNKVDANISIQSDLLEADYLKLQSEVNLSNAIIDTEIAYQKLLKSIGQ